MTEVDQQLANIQEQLKRYAQQLGQLNMMNNQFLQENQELSIQIKNLQNKIVKKKHKIQQENKDKNIIHQKLVKAQKIKEQLQIKQTQIQAQNQEQKLKQQKYREIQQNRKRLQKNKRNETQIQKIQEKVVQSHQQTLPNQNKSEETSKISEKKQIPPQKDVQNHKKENIPQKPTQIKQQIQEKKSSLSNYYTNSEKGDYQPPALFLDDEQDSQQDQNTLQILRQKLKQQKLNMAEQDDDQ